MSFHAPFVPQTILTHEVAMRYLALRKARLIGQLWTEGNGQYFLAPVEAIHGYNERRPISTARLTELVNSTPLVERKPAESERPGRMATCAA
ncbi:MAG TPA: hypothetical protein VG273_11930 [Bryobacteraceae bacterium]|jgi:hypothetical protein|nr:hypothetical protein [Bryobacteraceae bacterium]